MVRGTWEDAPEGQICLALFRGDRFVMVDSLKSERGAFYFLLSGSDPPGVYRLIFRGQNGEGAKGFRSVDFIFNREDLEITVTGGRERPVAYFGDSKENRIYRDFMEFELNYEAKITEVYGREGEEAARRYEELQLRRGRYIDSLSSSYPGHYAVRMIRAFRSPFLPGSMSHSGRIDTLKLCFFDHSAIDDPALLHAPVYPYRLTEYLSLYTSGSISREAQQEQFIGAVEHIMANTSYDRELREFVVTFLMDRFERAGMEKVLDHLALNYLDEWCETDLAGLVEARKEGSSDLVPGTPAPDLLIRDHRGTNHELGRMDHSYVLVMFWTTTCPHCLDLLPELHRWYTRERELDLEVVAISIDTSAAAFEAYTKQLQPRWIHAREPMGWLGRVPSDWFVYSTPSLFLLDHRQIILDRPVSFRQFMRALRKLE